MATVTELMAPATEQLVLGPHLNGVFLTPTEFDEAEFDRGWRYELIRGVLIVSPAPSIEERDPNEELGHLLRNFQESHANGSSLDATVSEHDVETESERRRVDRAIWAQLGRLPKRRELPTIAVEFVSPGKRNWTRDYEEKRDEYLSIGIREYWVFNRFARTLTVFKPDSEPVLMIGTEVLTTPLLPGFELPLSRIFECATRWADE